MNKELKDWTIIEIKAGIYDRQTEVAILQQELQRRLSMQVEVKKDDEKLPKVS